MSDVKIEYDTVNDEHILVIGEETLKKLGWSEGDTVKWTIHDDDSVSLTKVEEKELVLVECISSYRIRYVVEVPKGKAEYALDTVTMNQAKEFSQHWLGEQIASHRVIDENEYFATFDEDNAYLSKWDADQKKKMITPITKDDDIEHSEIWFDIGRNK